MNPAVLEGRPVLGQTQDEEPHVVLLPTPQAEAKAPGASLQLHGVTARALGGERRQLDRPLRLGEPPALPTCVSASRGKGVLVDGQPTGT